MLRKIEALREKPKYVRKAYAFWIASAFTGVIALVWVSTLPSRIDAITMVTADGTAEEQPGGFGSFFQDMSANVGTAVGNIRNGVEVYEARQDEPSDQETVLETPGDLRIEQYLVSTTTLTSTTSREDVFRSAQDRVAPPDTFLRVSPQEE